MDHTFVSSAPQRFFGLQTNLAGIAYFVLMETAFKNDVHLTDVLHKFHEDVQRTAGRYTNAYQLAPPLPHPFTYLNDCGYQVFQNGMSSLHKFLWLVIFNVF